MDCAEPLLVSIVAGLGQGISQWVISIIVYNTAHPDTAERGSVDTEYLQSVAWFLPLLYGDKIFYLDRVIDYVKLKV